MPVPLIKWFVSYSGLLIYANAFSYPWCPVSMLFDFSQLLSISY